MSEGLDPLEATDGRRALATRRSFLRGSGAVAEAGVTSLTAGGLFGGVADGATQATGRAPSA